MTKNNREVNILTSDDAEPRTSLRVLAATQCGTSSCPTVYEGSPGNIVVQGYIVPAASTGIDVPEGEMLVEIPSHLLAEALRKLS